MTKEQTLNVMEELRQLRCFVQMGLVENAYKTNGHKAKAEALIDSSLETIKMLAEAV